MCSLNVESSIRTLLEPPGQEKCTNTRFYFSEHIRVYALDGGNLIEFQILSNFPPEGAYKLTYARQVRTVSMCSQNGLPRLRTRVRTKYALKYAITVIHFKSSIRVYANGNWFQRQINFKILLLIIVSNLILLSNIVDYYRLYTGLY